MAAHAHQIFGQFRYVCRIGRTRGGLYLIHSIRNTASVPQIIMEISCGPHFLIERYLDIIDYRVSASEELMAHGAQNANFRTQLLS